MNETGLIVAEVVFLVLLYAFVWAVVRSSSRQLRVAQPPPPPAQAPPPPQAPVEVEVPVAAAPVAASTEGVRDLFADRTEGLGDGEPALDLAANLDPRLIVDASDHLEAGRTIALEGGITIGRSEAASLSIEDQFVSHMHARILRRGAYHFVEDLGSTNGTFLNDRRVEGDAQLKVHDALRIGQTTLRYEE